jgi:3-oxoacyl-[acyl-carrier-protein] synthase II
MSGLCFPESGMIIGLPLFQLCSLEPSANDVLVTGIGMVTPFGLGAKRSWSAVLNGNKAGRLLTAHDIDHFQQLSELIKRVPGGAPVDHVEVAMAVLPALSRNRWDNDTFTQYAHDCLNNIVLASLDEALADAGMANELPPPDRIGCVIGSSKASLRALEDHTYALRPDSRSTACAGNFWANSCLPDAPLRCVQQVLGATGPSLCPVAACASGLISVIQGAHLIRNGLCDVCIVGSADASLRASVLASFHRLGVTAKHEDPSIACRPFDREREGFIIGEGGAVLLLESRAHAEKRRARAYGQIVSGGWLTDPTGITQIDSSGSVVTELLRRMAQTSPPDIISLHGTGTVTNDLAESHGVGAAFGTTGPPCFGVKGAIGHLLGAAGSVEFALTLLAMRDGVVPPTVNFETIDEACGVDVAAVSRQMAIKSALKLSLGFGGHVAACGVVADLQ